MTHSLTKDAGYEVSFAYILQPAPTGENTNPPRLIDLRQRFAKADFALAASDLITSHPGPVADTILVNVLSPSPERASQVAAAAISLIAESPSQSPPAPGDAGAPSDAILADTKVEDQELVVSELKAELASHRDRMPTPVASPPNGPAIDRQGQTRTAVQQDVKLAEDRYFRILQLTGDLSLSPDDLRVAGFPELAILRTEYRIAEAENSEPDLAKFREAQKQIQLAAYAALKTRKDELANWRATAVESAGKSPDTTAFDAEAERLLVELEEAQRELANLKEARATDKAEPSGARQENAAQIQILSATDLPTSTTIVRSPTSPRLHISGLPVTQVLVILFYALLLAMGAVLTWSLLKLWRHDPGLMKHLLGVDVVHELREPSSRALDQLPPAMRNLAGFIVKRRESDLAEAFRKIRSAIWGQATHDGLAHIAIVVSQTAGNTSEGVALGMARTAAFSRRRVLLVDCRAPGGSIEDYLAEDPSMGLTEILSGSRTWEDVVTMDLESGAHILRFGGRDLPDTGLSDTAFRELMLEANKVYDLIILNGGPALENSLLPELTALSPIVIVTSPPPERQLVDLSRALQKIRTAGGKVTRLVVIRGSDTIGA